MEGKDKFCAQITKYDLLPGNKIMFVKQRKSKAKHREQNQQNFSFSSGLRNISFQRILYHLLCLHNVGCQYYLPEGLLTFASILLMRMLHTLSVSILLAILQQHRDGWSRNKTLLGILHNEVQSLCTQHRENSSHNALMMSTLSFSYWECDVRGRKRHSDLHAVAKGKKCVKPSLLLPC